MLKQVELAAHFRLPPYPPSPLTLSFLVLNLALSFIAPRPILFRLFAFLYANLILFRLHTIETYLKVVAMLNMTVIWAYWQGIQITSKQQSTIFWVCVVLFAQPMLYASVGVFKALTGFKKVQFDDVYWVIQLGSIVEYFYHFTGHRFLKFVPSFLRIVQNLRVGTTSSRISALRFVVMIIRDTQTPYSHPWLLLAVVVSIWQLTNNYVNQFAMRRVIRNKGLCIYPRPAMLLAFVMIVVAQWAWAFAPAHVGTFTIVRKMLWNYLRLECRLAEMYRKYALMEITHVEGKADLHNIIY